MIRHRGRGGAEVTLQQRNFSPKRQREPDCSQFHRVVLHWVVETSHKSQPDLVESKTKGRNNRLELEVIKTPGVEPAEGKEGEGDAEGSVLL